MVGIFPTIKNGLKSASGLPFALPSQVTLIRKYAKKLGIFN